MSLINVECVHVGEYQMNCYLVVNADTNELLIVDPGADAGRIKEKIGGRTPVAVLLTHGHYDHIGAVDALCGAYQIPLYMHKDDIPKLTSLELSGGQMFGREALARTEAIPLEGGQRLTLAGIELLVLHTPGHSAGSCCYLLPDGLGVLSGDTLFAHGYGRTDLYDGDFAQLKQSLRVLFHLTPKMPLYPGHEEAGMTGRDPAPENK